jgi:hypothetical protein
MKALIIGVALVLGGCATAEIVPVSADTYMISQASSAGVFVSMGKLKTDVIKRANAFAAEKGKVAEQVSEREYSAYPGRLARFEYRFKLVDKPTP